MAPASKFRESVRPIHLLLLESLSKPNA